MTRRLLLVLAVALIAPVAGCGDGSSDTPVTASTRSSLNEQDAPLNLDQAQLLAGAQFLNYRNDGADFEMTVGQPKSGSGFTLRGQMDWKQLIGYAKVTPATGEPFEVWWRKDIVIESSRALASLLAAADRPPVLVGHAPDPKSKPLDRAISILLELGSKKRDNPLLVRQKKGSTYLGDENVRGTSAMVLRYGEINRFWIAPETGLMLRFAGNSKDRNAAVLVDLLSHGPQTILAPQSPLVNEQQARMLARQFGVGG